MTTVHHKPATTAAHRPSSTLVVVEGWRVVAVVVLGYRIKLD
jgi:hypothetical protein